MYESLIFPRLGATIYMYEPHFLARKALLRGALSVLEYLPSTIEAQKKKRLLKTKRGGGKRKEGSLCFGISPLYINRGSPKKKGSSKQKEKVESKYMKTEARKREKVLIKKNRGLQGLLNENREREREEVFAKKK